MTRREDEAREHLAELRLVVIDRYQLTEPYDSSLVGAIDAAIEAGAAADLAGLRALVEEANLYKRHADLAEASLAAAESALTVEVPVEVPKVKPIERQSKGELLATAASQGVEVPEGATVADLRAALAPVGFQESEPDSEPSDESEVEPSAPTWTDWNTSERP